eukprot:TCONS_00057283-protein
MESNKSEYSERIEALELQELTAQNGGASLEVYKELLLLYLMEFDLINAKFLWKRIPLTVKLDNELTTIWKIGQCLWRREFPAVYEIIKSHEWSEAFKEPLLKLYSILQNRMTCLIENAYSLVKVEDLSQALGISEEQQLLDFINNRKWVLHSDTKLVKVDCQPDESNTTTANTQDKLDSSTLTQSLHRLTDYVSFLEN